MNRTLRRILVAVVVVCGLFMTAWLATAAARTQGPPEAAPIPLEAFEARANPEPPRPPVVGPAPRLVADAAGHDFGMVLQGEKVRHVFTLRNKGDAPAHIREVKTSCGCTATVLSTKLVPPGGTASVQTVFTAGGARGRFKKTVRVYSDDPGSPLILPISGKVSPLFRVEPELTLFGRVAPGRTQRRTVRIVAARPDLTFAPGPARSEGVAIDVQAPRPVAGQPGAYAVDLVARPRTATDSLNGAVLLPTGNGDSPYAVLRVAGDVEGAK